MKIGIVTVYNTENCGSFLQACALCRALEQKGHQVYFLEGITSTQKKYWYRLLKAMKYMLKFDFRKARELTAAYSVYRRLHQAVFMPTKTLDGMDLVIYGSDTIWNIEDEYFSKHWARFFGKNINAKKISYAASAGATPLEVFEKLPEIRTCLSEFSGLGVRDIPTGEIVKALLPNRKDVVQVLDPTMLLSPEEYEELSAMCAEKDFILVYYFGKMPEQLSQNIRAFAKERNKEIIAFGNRPWADVTLPYDPRLMLGYYKNADYVITNTFHGNIFSILFQKEFVSFGKQKRKVRALLEEFELSSRLLDETEEINIHFKQPIDYKTVEQKLQTKKEISYRYLDTFLDA